MVIRETYLSHFVKWVFIAFFASTITAQNQTNNWYFGNNAGLSFSNGNVNPLTNGDMVAPVGSAVISDKNGNLLFYTNGATIWNKNHTVMENGSFLAGEITNNQSSIIVPLPNSTERFFVFTTRVNPSTNPNFQPGLYYSEVEISDTYPEGRVVSKNSLLRSNISQRIAAYYNHSDNSVRLITFGASSNTAGAPLDTFFIYHITELGITGAVKTSRQRETIGRNGAMKLSPNGQYLAIADYEGAAVYTYNFDVDTSTITFKEQISTNIPFSAINPFSLEFSQNSNVLYFNGDKMIFKWSMVPIDGFDRRQNVSAAGGFSYGSMQLARNGKIYVANYSDETEINTLSVINSPDNFDGDSDFETQFVDLNSGESLVGLPLFMASFFRNRIISESNCFGESFAFDLDTYAPIESVIWDFGNGVSSTETSPVYTYDRDGTFMVKASVTLDDCVIELFKEIEVYAKPNPADNRILQQCVADETDVTLFNLNEIVDKLNLRNRDYTLTFYESLNDAVNEDNPIATPESYQNTLVDQELFVKVSSLEGCSDITNFFLATKVVNISNISPLYGCENSDGVDNNNESFFDLRSKAESLKSELSLDNSVRIRFYRSFEDAQLESLPLPFEYTSSNETIWARIETSQDDCAGLGSFELRVNGGVQLQISQQYKLCYDPVQSSVSLDGGVGNDSWEWTDENGTLLSTNRLFTTTETGNFTLTVYNSQNGLKCSRTETFRVVEPEEPSIASIETGNGFIGITLDATGDYQFSIDGRNFVGSGTNHTFENVRGGIYTVYIQDRDQCEKQLQESVAIVSYPKFFTPNDDGYHDRWRVYGISREFYQSAEINIYDRYGKPLYTMNLKDNVNGWDGTFKGSKLNSNDYWFESKLTDLEGNLHVETGHFTLKY